MEETFPVLKSGKFEDEMWGNIEVNITPYTHRYRKMCLKCKKNPVVINNYYFCSSCKKRLPDFDNDFVYLSMDMCRD
jgi:hypothetical protein